MIKVTLKINHYSNYKLVQLNAAEFTLILKTGNIIKKLLPTINECLKTQKFRKNLTSGD